MEMTFADWFNFTMGQTAACFVAGIIALVLVSLPFAIRIILILCSKDKDGGKKDENA